MRITSQGKASKRYSQHPSNSPKVGAQPLGTHHRIAQSLIAFLTASCSWGSSSWWGCSFNCHLIVTWQAHHFFKVSRTCDISPPLNVCSSVQSCCRWKHSFETSRKAVLLWSVISQSLLNVLGGNRRPETKQRPFQIGIGHRKQLRMFKCVCVRAWC